MRHASPLILAALLLSCAPPRTQAPPRTVERAGEVLRDGVEAGPIVRVALREGASSVSLSATGSWRVYVGDRPGRVLVRGAARERWTAEASGRRVRLRRGDGVPTTWQPAPLLVRPLADSALVMVDGKRYRGDLLLDVNGSGLVVVNRLPVEWYLRGVVPLEIGQGRRESERAAAEAQAVAARSNAYVKLREGAGRAYDVRASVLDQVYGGVDAERPVSSAAVEATTGLVLRYGGRVVSAPFHSACGGSTAEPPEVWRASGVPYLRRVSDRIPGTDRYWCEDAPRFRWAWTWTGAELDTLVERYLRRMGDGRARGRVRRVAVDGRTPSGRAAALVVETDGGVVRLRGNEMRDAFRSPAGEMLNSTFVRVRSVADGDGPLARLTLEGNGYGHGIGMCQWGAIGRARAGQDFRAILAAYFPGATVGSAR